MDKKWKVKWKQGYIRLIRGSAELKRSYQCIFISVELKLAPRSLTASRLTARTCAES